MSLSEERENGKTRLKFEGALTIYDVAGLREALLKLIGVEGELEIDFSGVGDCDAAGLQLLCALRKSAEHRDNPIRVIGPSRGISTALDAAGLDSNEIM